MSVVDKAVFLAKNWELVGNYLLAKYGKHHWILATLKGLRNGFVVLQKLQQIFALTRTHALNLAKFVCSYKFLTGALARAQGEKKEWHSFIAAFVMGYFVFGENNNVNMQINLYLLSRVAVGLAKLATKNEIIAQPKQPVFPWFAAIVWGLVLWLFEHHKDVLQVSLQKSMTYLYSESEIWTGIRDFILRNSSRNI